MRVAADVNFGEIDTIGVLQKTKRNQKRERTICFHHHHHQRYISIQGTIKFVV